MSIGNREKALELLEEYEGHVRAYARALQLDREANTSAIQRDLRKLDSAVKTVIKAINHRIFTDWYVGAEGFAFYSQRAIEEARGDLDNEERVAGILGLQGPQMNATSLHSVVWNAAAALWDDGHVRQAVQTAATFANALVQAKIGRTDISDKALMTEAFSNNDPEPDKPRLRWPGDPRNQTVKSMNEGLRMLAPGVFATIRNPASHRTDEMDEQEALEQLAALSLLCRWVDQCEVIRAS
jgi:Protein of unknown function (Hypoth_ymh)